MEYSATPTAGYKVVSVVVGGIDAECDGNGLSVALTKDATTIGSGGPVTIAGSSMTAPIGTPPLAANVNDVHVEIAGHAVPAACAALTFDHTFVGTEDEDKLEGTNQRDLILLLGDNDEGKGGPADDCVDGGDGKDKLEGGPGGDQINGVEDDDKIEGGPGGDVIDCGPGTEDEADGGPGADTFQNCEKEKQ